MRVLSFWPMLVFELVCASICCVCGLICRVFHSEFTVREPITGRDFPNFLLISMNSHVIPIYTMRTGRGAPRPHNKNPKSGFIQAPHSSNDEIRRASEQTSPQVARAAGHPASRDEGGELGSGSSSIRRFPFGPRQPHTIERRVRQWHADSEVKATTRWTLRAGSRSRPLFAVCLNPQIPIGNPEKRPSW